MSEVTLTPSGPPETVIADEPAPVREALAAALDRTGDDRRTALAEVVASDPRSLRGLGAARGRRPRRHRALRRLPGRLPPRARHAPRQRVARQRLRPVGARRQPRVPAGTGRPAAHGRRDRRGRRGRALRPLPAPARPCVAARRSWAADRRLQRRGALRRGQPPHGPRQGDPRGRRARRWRVRVADAPCARPGPGTWWRSAGTPTALRALGLDRRRRRRTRAGARSRRRSPRCATRRPRWWWCCRATSSLPTRRPSRRWSPGWRPPPRTWSRPSRWWTDTTSGPTWRGGASRAGGAGGGPAARGRVPAPGLRRPAPRAHHTDVSAADVADADQPRDLPGAG